MPYMKSIASVLSIIALGMGLLSCSNSGGGGGGTGTASETFTRVALVPNQADDTVSVFLVDNANGRLRPRGYVVSGTSPRAVAVHPSGKFFYTANSGSNNVSVHTVSSTGLATAVTGSPFSLTGANGPTAVAVSPNGLFLFVANQTSSNISVLSIDQTTGALLAEVSGSPFSQLSAVSPTTIAVNPPGNLLFVTNSNGSPGTLSVFIIDSIGSLTPVAGSPFQVGLNPQALALNATGTVVYVANKGSNSISTFSVDQNTGALAPIAAPFSTGTAPSSVAVGPGGQFLYVANSGAGTIRWVPIDAVTGALISGGSNVAVANPQFIRIDPTERTLYATDSTSNLVSFFSTDSVTGQLTLAGTRAMKDSPGALAFVSGTSAVTPTPTFTYVANAGDDTVSAFAITLTTGLLTPIGGSPFPVPPGAAPVSLSADPLAKYLYVGNSGTDNLSAFTINGTTGNLTGIAGSPFSLLPSTNPQSVATDPLGRYVYVANQGSNHVSAFSIVSGTGILTTVTGSPFSTGGPGLARSRSNLLGALPMS
jgi:6-phosphogluconolactonase